MGRDEKAEERTWVQRAVLFYISVSYYAILQQIMFAYITGCEQLTSLYNLDTLGGEYHHLFVSQANKHSFPVTHFL